MDKFQMCVLRGRLRLVMGVLVMVAGTGTASAQAAVLGHNGQLHGCVARSGVLRVIGSNVQCRRHEQSIEFGMQGNPGAAGERGPAGTVGPAGAIGPQGPAGTPADATAVSTLESEVSTLQSQVAALKATLSGVSNDGTTLLLKGLNLQIESGAGSTNAPVNGLGNLIIGYNGNPGTQTGSHNLVLGDGQAFTSYGGILAGSGNSITAPDDSVIGGSDNSATAQDAVVAGGDDNLATAPGASVSGGCNNLAGPGTPPSGGCNGDGLETVSGGYANQASGQFSAISGGDQNKAEGQYSSASGGFFNQASGIAGWVSGGAGNTAQAQGSVSGGFDNVASGLYASVSGGEYNTASGASGSISGGEYNAATDLSDAVSGGCDNVAGEGAFPLSEPLLSPMDGGCPTNGSSDTIDWIGGGVADQTAGIVQSTIGGNSLRLPNGSDEFDALIGPT